MNTPRRQFLGIVGGLYVATTGSAQTAFAPDMVREDQRGDETIETEALVFNAQLVQRMAAKSNRASFEIRDPSFGASLVELAATWVGRNRRNARDDIARLLELFHLPFDIDGKPVPFCAAGISYLSAAIYDRRRRGESENTTSGLLRSYLGDVDHHHFMPSPSVWDITHVARGKRRWVDAGPTAVTPLSGWLVVFDFGGGADHVGLVESYSSKVIRTIEFNTVPENAVGDDRNGGAVARRMRAYPHKTIKGFVRTDLTKPT